MEPLHCAANALLLRLTAVLVMKMQLEIDDPAVVLIEPVELKSRITQLVAVALSSKENPPPMIELRMDEPGESEMLVVQHRLIDTTTLSEYPKPLKTHFVTVMPVIPASCE